jgi:hypothetical protein
MNYAVTMSKQQAHVKTETLVHITGETQILWIYIFEISSAQSFWAATTLLLTGAP